MSEIDLAVHRARNEWKELGCLTVVTEIELSNLGVDVDALEEEFALGATALETYRE